MKQSTLSKLEATSERFAKANGLKVSIVMRDENEYRAHFETAETEERKAGFK